jgi:hypothetical protein
MRFYMSGKWEEREEIKELQEEICKLGHMLIVDWTGHEKDDPGFPSQYAIDDIQGASDCDFYVGLFKNPYYYKGALVEMGASLAYGRKVYIIGHAIDSCLFVNHPLVQKFATKEDFIKFLDDERMGYIKALSEG